MNRRQILVVVAAVLALCGLLFFTGPREGDAVRGGPGARGGTGPAAPVGPAGDGAAARPVADAGAGGRGTERNRVAASSGVVSVRARLVDPLGRPVRFLRVRTPEGHFPPIQFRAAEDGSFALNLPAPDGELPWVEITSELWLDHRVDRPPVEEDVCDLGELVMQPRGLVAGTVVGPDNLPLSGVEVHAYAGVSPDGPLVRPLGDRLASAETDASGTFQLLPLLPGSVAVVAESPLYHRTVADGVAVPEPPRAGSARLRMDAGLAWTGRVVDAAAQPVADAAIEAWLETGPDGGEARIVGSRGAPHRTATAGSDGAFRLAGLGDTTYTVRVAAPDFLALQLSGVRPGGDDRVIVLERGGAIEGVVATENGDPVVDFRVKAVRASGAAGADPFNTALERLTANEDEDGADNETFRLSGLPGGTYRLRVTADGFAESLSDEIELSPGTVETGVLVTLRPGRSLRVTVLDAATRAPVRQAWVEVEPRRVHDEFSFVDDLTGRSVRVVGAESLGWPKTAATDANGAAGFAGLNPEEHRVAVEAAGYSPVTAFTASDPEETLRVLLPRSAGVAGTVRDAAGKPVAGGRVVLTGPASKTDLDPGPRSYADVGPGGEYAFADLRPGHYSIFHTLRTVLASRLAGDAGDAGEARALAITIEAGATVAQDLRAQLGATLTGRCELHGEPAGGLAVALFAGERDVVPTAHTRTKRSGEFDFGRVAPGAYEVRVQGAELAAPIRRRVELTEDEHEHLVIVQGVGWIAGTVVDKETRDGVPGALVRVVELANPVEVGDAGPAAGGETYVRMAVTPTGDRALVSFGPRETRTDADGVFRLKLPDGRYAVRATAENYLPAIRIDVETRPDDAPWLTFPLQPGVDLTGRVVREGTREVAAGKAVWIEGPRAKLREETDAEGNFSFPGIQPGAYRVWVGTEFEPEVSTEVEVGAGSPSKLVLVVPKP